MSFFLRKVSGAPWDGAKDVSPEWQGKARKDFSLRPGEESFSIYEATTEAERARTATAFALERRDKKPIDLLEVSEAELTAIGRLERDGDGAMCLADVNARHCSLHATQEALLALVDTLRAAGRNHQRFRWKDDLLPALRALDHGELVGDERDEVRTWIESVCPPSSELK